MLFHLIDHDEKNGIAAGERQINFGKLKDGMMVSVLRQV